MIFDAALRALGQVGDPAFRRVLIRGIWLTLMLFAVIAGLVIWGVSALVPPTLTLPFIGEIAWADNLAFWAAALALLIGSVVLMVPTASAFTSLYLDEVAEAVEARHYPRLPPARRQPFFEALTDSIAFLMVLIGVNLVALIFYLVFPPTAPFLFYAVNGWLLGREYFQIAAARRVGPDAAKALRRRHRGTIWAAGALMAVPLSVPVVNLLVPVLGAATFTHLYHRLGASA